MNPDRLAILKEVMPYKWRVQSFSKNKPKAQCVAYVDARQVMDKLDDVLGEENWQSDFKEVKGHVYGGIGILVNGAWVWKWDCGTESNVDAEKGEASDSFKRAAVKWGVGRFLYSLEMVWLDANEVKKDGNWPFIVDNQGKRVWNVTEHINKVKGIGKKQPPPKKAEPPKPDMSNEFMNMLLSTKDSGEVASTTLTIKKAVADGNITDDGRDNLLKLREVMLFAHEKLKKEDEIREDVLTFIKEQLSGKDVPGDIIPDKAIKTFSAILEKAVEIGLKL